MADYGKAVREVLKENGCYFLRHAKGDHDIWENPANGKQTVIDGKIKSRHIANVIMKQLEIDHHF